MGRAADIGTYDSPASKDSLIKGKAFGQRTSAVDISKGDYIF